MAQRLAKGVGKPKPTPICPFLFHLYEGQGLLTADEELDYRTAKEMARYRITPDPDSRPGTDEDEPTPTPAPSPQPGPSRTRGGNQKPEAEIHIQGTFRISTSSVRGTIEPSSSGTTAKGAATGSSTGRKTGVGGQALRQHSKRIPAGSESIRVDGEGAGADRLRARDKPG